MLHTLATGRGPTPRLSPRFDRTRDWADIEAMLLARTLDLDAVRDQLERMLPPDDERFARLDEAVRRADATPA